MNSTGLTLDEARANVAALEQAYLAGTATYSELWDAKDRRDAIEMELQRQREAAQREADAAAMEQRARDAEAAAKAALEEKTQREAVPRKRLAELQSMLPHAHSGFPLYSFGSDASEALVGAVLLARSEVRAKLRQEEALRACGEIFTIRNMLGEEPEYWERPDTVNNLQPKGSTDALLAVTRIALASKSWAEFNRAIDANLLRVSHRERIAVAQAISADGKQAIAPREPTKAQISKLNAAKQAVEDARAKECAAHSALRDGAKFVNGGLVEERRASTRKLESQHSEALNARMAAEEHLKRVRAALDSENCALE